MSKGFKTVTFAFSPASKVPAFITTASKEFTSSLNFIFKFLRVETSAVFTYVSKETNDITKVCIFFSSVLKENSPFSFVDDPS